MHLLTAGSVLALLSITPAIAQTGNPAATAPATREQSPGVPAPGQTNQTDLGFARDAAVGGLAEVDLGRLAEQKSQDEAVRAFARRMVEDHTKANEQLTNIARGEQIPLPTELDPDHSRTQGLLANLSGPQFDIEYLRLQLQDHQRTAHLLAHQIGAGENAALQQYAMQALPTVLRHLEMIRDLMTQTAQQQPQAASAPPKASGLPTLQAPRTPKD
jgi:putative membrane protein